MIESLITRVGFRTGLYLNDTKTSSAFVKADVLREWAGEQDIRVRDKTTGATGADASFTNHSTWFDVGTGFQAGLSENVFAYGDVEYRFGNDFEKTWLFNVGARCVF